MRSFKRRKWKFYPENQNLEEFCQNPLNPVRGWYAVYTFPVEQKIVPEELKWSLREGETTVLVLLDIGVFRDRPLDIQALDNVRNILQFFEDYRRDVILRPVYDREGKGLQHEPENFSLVLTHLQQLGELLSSESYSVFVFQGLLVGSWGEMHTSRYLSEECLREMWNTLRSRLNKDIVTAVRTPAQWRTLIEESEYQKKEFHATGIFDDGIFGSLSHLGTFGTMMREAAGWKNPWNRKEELDFLEYINGCLPCGGEVVARTTAGVEEDTEAVNTDSVLGEMKKMRLVYLNHVYDAEILEQWKKQILEVSGVWNGASLYEYAGAHLGYRFTIKKAEIQVLRPRRLRFLFTIENSGFGSLCQEAELLLTVQNAEKSREYHIPYDIRRLPGGEMAAVEVTAEAMEGKVYLRLQRKKDKRTIYFVSQKNADSLYLGCLHSENL